MRSTNGTEPAPAHADETMAEEAEAFPRTSWPRRFVRLLLFLLAGSVLYVLVHQTPLRELLDDAQALQIYLEGDNLRAELIFVLLVVVLVACGAPRLVFYFSGGVAFGFWEGLILAQAGSLGGSFLTYRLIRYVGREWFQEHFRGFAWIRGKIPNASSVGRVMLVRQLPVSGFFINAALALGTVRTLHFLLGSFVGFLPQGVIACLVGSGVVEADWREGLERIALAFLLVLLGGAYLMYRKRGTDERGAAHGQ